MTRFSAPENASSGGRRSGRQSENGTLGSTGTLTVEPDDKTVQCLQSLVRLQTVSNRNTELVDPVPFAALLAELRQWFPLLHERLDVVAIPEHALLMRWRGSSNADPVVLMAHLDVVPVDLTAPWTFPPFDAAIADSPEGPAVWGRGTLDDKGCIVAICAAIEGLLGDGFVPRRDVWLSFGCDEEVGGTSAVRAVAHLRSAGVRPWFVLDEGGAVADEVFPGVSRPVAVIGVAEKGNTILELRAEGRGGHASTPARGGPTARLAAAVSRVDRMTMPLSLPEPTAELLRRLGPHVPAPVRPFLTAAGGRLRRVTTWVLAGAGPESAAMTRTTLAVTTLQGAPAPNVLASSASAAVNARIAVGESVGEVADRLRRAVVKMGVSVDVVEPVDPSPVSPHADSAFELLEQTTQQIFPWAVTAPYVMMAGTDSRHFTGICERVYRFAPFRMSKAQRASIHSYDERLSLSALREGVDWYAALVRGLPG